MSLRPRRLPLRGRDNEIRVLSEQLAVAHSGAGSVSVIEAGPGLGKTRLIEEAIQLAGRSSVAVGRGDGDQAKLAVYLAPLLEALFQSRRPLLDRSAALGNVDEPGHWLVLELWELLEARAKSGPMLICLDDLQWADLGTLSAVRGLAGQTAGSPIAWIIALRQAEAGGDRLRQVDALVEAGAARLELAPLEAPAVAALVEDVVGASPDEALSGAADAAGGNPFLLRELLDGFAEEGAIKVVAGRAGLHQSVLPQRVQWSVQRRLTGLPSLPRHAAGVAAVLGRSFRFSDLATMLGRPATETHRLVAELERADIVVTRGSQFAFRHDLVHEAVLRTLPGPSVRALERQAAEVLLDAGAAPVEIATRMAHSADVGDEVAIDILRRASRTLASTDPRMAAQLSRSALGLLPGGDPREGALVKEVVLLTALGGDADAARELADRTARTLPVAEQAELALTVATMLSARATTRLAAGRQALALEGVPDALRVVLTATVAFNLFCVGLPKEGWLAVARAERMIQDAGSAEGADALAMSRLQGAEVDGDYSELLRRVRGFRLLSEAPEDQAMLRVVEVCEANALCGLDRLDEAIAVITKGLRTAIRDRQGWVAYRWEVYRGRFLVQTGQLTDGRAAAEWILEQEVIGVPQSVALLALARVSLHTDDRGLARKCEVRARETLEVVTHDFEVRRNLVLLLILQALGRSDDESLDHAFGLLDEFRSDSVLPLGARENCDDPHVVRAALRIQAFDVADQVIAEARARAAKNPAVASLQASAAHAHGLRHQNAAELRSAVQDFTGGPRPLALASALEDLGALSAREGRQDEAIDALGRALESYASCGATWDARRTRQRLRTLGVRRRLVTTDRPDNGWAALTPTETQVARLIGQGLTNKAVAERLFISPNTVGTHVRHVFEKLGVRSRIELAGHIARDARS
jgi:DNA-binding CsgD family transcriptional regulator